MRWRRSSTLRLSSSPPRRPPLSTSTGMLRKWRMLREECCSGRSPGHGIDRPGNLAPPPQLWIHSAHTWDSDITPHPGRQSSLAGFHFFILRGRSRSRSLSKKQFCWARARYEEGKHREGGPEAERASETRRRRARDRATWSAIPRREGGRAPTPTRERSSFRGGVGDHRGEDQSERRVLLRSGVQTTARGAGAGGQEARDETYMEKGK